MLYIFSDLTIIAQATGLLSTTMLGLQNQFLFCKQICLCIHPPYSRILSIRLLSFASESKIIIEMYRFLRY